MTTATRCRAKDPNLCRVHGRAAHLSHTLDQMFETPFEVLRATLTNSAPAYATDGLNTRIAQFNDRLRLFKDDFNEHGNIIESAEYARSVLSHRLAPVIGWLHSDVSSYIPDYTTSAARQQVDAIHEQMLNACKKVASL